MPGMDGFINFNGTLEGSIAGGGGGDVTDVKVRDSQETTFESVVNEEGVAEIDLISYVRRNELSQELMRLENDINTELERKQNIIDYSTNEQIIATWFGKPIYQKIIDWSSSPVNIPSTWLATTIDSSNIERVIDCKGLHADGTFYTTDADPTGNNHTNLKMRNVGGGGTYSYVILQYTKIND